MLAVKMLTKIWKQMRTLSWLRRTELMKARVIVLVIYVLFLLLHLLCKESIAKKKKCSEEKRMYRILSYFIIFYHIYHIIYSIIYHSIGFCILPLLFVFRHAHLKHVINI